MFRDQERESILGTSEESVEGGLVTGQDSKRSSRQSEGACGSCSLVPRFEFQPKVRMSNQRRGGLDSSSKSSKNESRRKRSKKHSMRKKLLQVYGTTSMVASLDKNIFLKNAPFAGELQGRKNLKSKLVPLKVTYCRNMGLIDFVALGLEAIRRGRVG